MTTKLCDLAIKYHCDKAPEIRHGYTPYYSEILSGKNVKRILEIGIGTALCMSDIPDYVVGASLYMWRDYFPETDVVGWDIDPSCFINNGRIRSLYCDQGSIGSLFSAAYDSGGKFDLIIDDGSHIPEHQILTANVLIPLLLEENGLYIIEDVLNPAWVRPLLQYPHEMKEFDIERRLDDRLLVIRGKQKTQ